ncbi:MAG: 2-amino-4-hydroxy-6-hydroxymethyldihydropteridine diphosphokinase [Candidatus Omnitrophica bacterium]|nr:2-amino-4-hydroxy-6-hydroxymethyldihydropteridine diphosphokinase [Candidatus Omnitrophota bacterium]
MLVTCFLGVGSNLGNRKRFIKLALEKLSKLKGTKIIKVSRTIETKPVGGPPGQGEFLNACLKIETSLSPSALLKNLKNIELELGRKKTVRWGPRSIDLDILLYGNRIIKRKELKVPHPKMLEREFVLRPLLEIL